MNFWLILEILGAGRNNRLELGGRGRGVTQVAS